MPNEIKINQLTSELEIFRSLKSKHQGSTEYFVADSPVVVEKLLNSSLEIDKLLCHEEYQTKTQKSFNLYRAPKSVLEDIVGHSLHHGVMASAKRPDNIQIDEFNEGPIVVLDGLSKADNVGAIVRNAAGFKVNQIIISEDCAHPYHRRAIRTSMGNVFSMKVRQSTSLLSDLKELKVKGYKIFGFDNRPAAKTLPQVEFAKKSVLIIGSEGSGMKDSINQSCDELILIPVDETVFAYNASCASAIALYELSNQLKTIEV